MQKCPTCLATAPTVEAPFCWQCGCRLPSALPTAAPAYSTVRETMLSRAKEVMLLKEEMQGVVSPVLPPPRDLPPPMPVGRLEVVYSIDNDSSSEDLIFNEMDLRNKEMVSLDDFRCILLRCELQDIDIIDIADMFRRADINRDHHLSRTEFSILFGEYPKLFEIMKNRIERYWLESESLSKISTHRTKLESLKFSEQSTHEEQVNADHEANDKTNRLNETVQLAMDAQMQERVHRGAMETAKDEADLARSELQDILSKHSRAQEAVRQYQIVIRDQDRECDLDSRKIESHKTQLSKAEERKAELERALDAQLRDIETITGRVEKATADAAASKERLQESKDLLLKSESDFEMMATKLQEAQAEVTNKEKNHHSANLAHKDSAVALERVQHHREEALSHSRWAKDRHQEFVECNSASRRELQTSIEEEERSFVSLNSALERQKSKNRESDSDQLTVIQTEIRLKRQRRQLEEEEQSLAMKTKSPTPSIDQQLTYHVGRSLMF